MSGQLTFDNLSRNVTVSEKESKRLGRQAKRILSILKKRAIWTNELGDIAKQYNARLKEIREMLASLGWTVDITARGEDGNNRYELRPLAGSKYQQHLMARQAKGAKDEISN